MWLLCCQYIQSIRTEAESALDRSSQWCTTLEEKEAELQRTNAELVAAAQREAAELMHATQVPRAHDTVIFGCCQLERLQIGDKMEVALALRWAHIQ